MAETDAVHPQKCMLVFNKHDLMEIETLTADIHHEDAVTVAEQQQSHSGLDPCSSSCGLIQCSRSRSEWQLSATTSSNVPKERENGYDHVLAPSSIEKGALSKNCI